MKERVSAVDSYKHQLGISWRTTIQHGRVDRPSIITVPEQQRHEILLPPGNVAQCDLVHELIHARWAEQYDPILATVFFSSRYNQNSPELAQAMSMTYYAQQLVDVWVQDAMKEKYPQLLQEDVETTLAAFLHVPDQVARQMGHDLLLTIALNRAGIERNGVQNVKNKQKQAEDRFDRIFKRDGERQRKRLTDLYKKLPAMPSEREVIFSEFQYATQRAAQILGFPITPQLVSEDDRTVWIFDSLC